MASIASFPPYLGSTPGIPIVFVFRAALASLIWGHYDIMSALLYLSLPGHSCRSSHSLVYSNIPS